MGSTQCFAFPPLTVPPSHCREANLVAEIGPARNRPARRTRALCEASSPRNRNVDATTKACSSEWLLGAHARGSCGAGKLLAILFTLCREPRLFPCLPGQIEDPANADLVTYVMEDEDHTLGNALRYTLMRSKDTAFCGYSVPHPTESRINIRLQTTGRPAHEVMQEGISNLKAASDAMASAFDAALADFDASEQQ